MKARIFVTLCLAATLAAPALAAPSPTAVVQNYLADRNSHNLTAAYALLSPATRQTIPLKEFAATRAFPDNPAMTPPLRAVFALVMDNGGAQAYDYHVTGVNPTDAGVVLVSATPHGDTKGTMTLKIATVADPQADGAPRLDLLQSLNRTEPNHFQLLLKAREAARSATSMSNLRQISLAILIYAQAHNDRLPDADRWVDEIVPYLVDPKATTAEKERTAKSLFRDPTAPEGKNWTYAYNRNLSHVSLSTLKDPVNTVMVYESTTGVKNAADTGQSLPHPGWHSGSSHVAFADGHVKLIPDKPTTETPAPKFVP